MQICPVAVIVPGLSPLDAFELHSQLLHKTNGLHGIDVIFSLYLYLKTIYL